MGTFIRRSRMKTTATRNINIYQKVFILMRLIHYPGPLTLPWQTLRQPSLLVLAQPPRPSLTLNWPLPLPYCVLGLCQNAFFIMHNRGSKWRRLTNLPINSALMLETHVKLFFFSSESKISSATSFEVRFSRSIYAL